MLRRVFNIVSAIVLVAALALAVAFAGVRLVGLTPYAVLSGSMEPQYPVGSLIYVQDKTPEAVQVGDAITFSLDSGTLVTHQVYDIDAEGQLFYTQGIANVDESGAVIPDAAPVPFSRLAGVPVFCIPFLGYVNAWCTSTSGFFAIVSLVGAFIALSIVVELLDGRKKSSRSGSAVRGSHARP
ncbi:MAG: signal peptidase I [Slackia sp.]|nr:signal peptidase I [Slackia sp.]